MHSADRPAIGRIAGSSGSGTRGPAMVRLALKEGRLELRRGITEALQFISE
jgi:hypothetical protein